VTLWNKALALYKLGQFSQAISIAATALDILEQLESSHTVQIREFIAKWQESVAP
jgi:hypothetical protein